MLEFKKKIIGLIFLRQHIQIQTKVTVIYFWFTSEQVKWKLIL